MVIALSQSAREPDKAMAHLDDDNLQLNINLSVTLGLTAEQAKRKLTRFLVDEVSLLIHPQQPLLVIVDENRIFWRFSLFFSMGQRGKLGQVGDVDVDALSGELIFNDDQIAEIKSHARLLAQSTPLSTNN